MNNTIHSWYEKYLTLLGISTPWVLRRMITEKFFLYLYGKKAVLGYHDQDLKNISTQLCNHIVHIRHVGAYTIRNKILLIITYIAFIKLVV